MFGCTPIWSDTSRARVLVISAACLTFLPLPGKEGTFVHAGAPNLAPPALDVISGQIARLDLLVPRPLATENRCRTTLYALGGRLLVKVDEQEGVLTSARDESGGDRIALEFAIPPARPGARFVLKTECLTPTPTVLGSVELRVMDGDPIADLRAQLAGRPVVVAGTSPLLKSLRTVIGVMQRDDWATLENAVIFTGNSPDGPETDSSLPQVHVAVSYHADHTLTLMAQQRGEQWHLVVHLPASVPLTSPGGLSHLLKIVQFIKQLHSSEP